MDDGVLLLRKSTTSDMFKRSLTSVAALMAACQCHRHELRLPNLRLCRDCCPDLVVRECEEALAWIEQGDHRCGVGRL
jgi:hypothetical protein